MRDFEDVPPDWAPASVWYDDQGRRQQTLEFIVAGVPVSKGNMIRGRYGGYHDATKGIDEWVAIVSQAAAVAMQGRYRAREKAGKPIAGSQSHTGALSLAPSVQPLDRFEGAVMLDITFVMRRPKATPKRRTPQAIKKPDLDKLVRAIGDSLTGTVWKDDSQVVELHARKRLADRYEEPGVHILVTSNVEVK